MLQQKNVFDQIKVKEKDGDTVTKWRENENLYTPYLPRLFQ